MNEINYQNIENSDNEGQKSLAETILNEFENGLISVLFRRIGDVTITDSRIRDAFKLFLHVAEQDKTFSAFDVIFSADMIVKGKLPNENVGNKIFCLDRIPNNKKLKKHTVLGIYSLLSLHNGIVIDIDAVGGSLKSAEIKPFLVIPENKLKGIKNIAENEKINLHSAGQLISTNQMIVTREGDVIASLDKSVLKNKDGSLNVKLGSEHFGDFLSGYNSVLTASLSEKVSANNIIRFGITNDINKACAKALGYFMAKLFTKNDFIRYTFFDGDYSTVAVDKPNFTDGDYLYLLKLRDDQNRIPEKTHYNQLSYYISEKKRTGIIKNVLPLRENIEATIQRLCGDDLEFVSLNPIPKENFGVVVSVGRGESVNGVKIGYFKNI